MKVPDIIKQAARDLKKQSTESEIILWNILKRDNLGVRFLRQKPLYVYTEDGGLDRYIIPDFYCHSKKIVIEVDGSIHNLGEVHGLDRIKEGLLLKLGIKVLRITNEDILYDLDKVVYQIKQYVIT